MLVYNPVPDEIRRIKSATGIGSLNRTANNLAETIFKLKTSDLARVARLIDYLRRINPSVLNIDTGSADANY